MASVSAPSRAADVDVVSTFEGNKGPGWKAAANVMGTVGTSHVVDFTEGASAILTKRFEVHSCPALGASVLVPAHRL
jgi:hypothetical protein